LLEPLKSIRGGMHLGGLFSGGMHLGGDMKLVNECCRRHNGATTSIDDKLAHLASNGTPGVVDLLPLARFKGNLFGMNDSSNH